jgi:hypothetical protein
MIIPLSIIAYSHTTYLSVFFVIISHLSSCRVAELSYSSSSCQYQPAIFSVVAAKAAFTVINVLTF